MMAKILQWPTKVWQLPKVRHLVRSTLRYFSGGQNNELSDETKTDKINFSGTYVDMRKINAMMNINSGDRILTVAASGAHAISKLLADPEEVVALDISASQLRMSKLQAVGMKLLSREEFCTFIGINRELTPSKERMQIYEDIRSALDADSIEFWDRSKNLIKDGILYCGEFENAFINSFNAFYPTEQDKATIRQFLELGDDMETQRRVYKGLRETSQWRAVFRNLLNFECFSIMRNVLEDDQEFDTLLLNTFNHVCNNVPNNRSHMLESYMTGDLTICQLPAYLREGNFELIKDRLDRIKWVEGDIVDHISDSVSKPNLRKFDGINLSTVPVYYDQPEKLPNMMKCAVALCNSGSMIVYYVHSDKRNNRFQDDLVEKGLLSYGGQDLTHGGFLIPRCSTVI
ncbi:unnamed protein product [Owenia fusiformis]|uniref:Uncharacterized protein n=1 Tax=Owenia fusiformis TaxID=6347 RepID=A0A8J1UQG0_OWEFU|nr:unnamed protein product [Owenia fusiformis]